MREEIIIEFEKIFELSDAKAKIILDYLIYKPHQRLIFDDGMSEIIFDSLLRAGYFSTKESRRDRKINKVLNDNNGTKGHN